MAVAVLVQLVLKWRLLFCGVNKKKIFDEFDLELCVLVLVSAMLCFACNASHLVSRTVNAVFCIECILVVLLCLVTVFYICAKLQ